MSGSWGGRQLIRTDDTSVRLISSAGRARARARRRPPGGALRRPAHLHRRHAARRGKAGHRVRPQGEGVSWTPGQLVPDDVMLGLVSERLAPARRGRAGGCSTGSPAHRAGEDLQQIVGRRGIDLAINLEVPRTWSWHASRRAVSARLRHQLLGRLAIRRTTGSCDKCGGEVVQRDDDTEEAVRKRLSLYNEQTAPLLSLVRRAGPARDRGRRRGPRRDLRADRALLGRGPYLRILKLPVPRRSPGCSSGKRSIVGRGVFRGEDDDRTPGPSKRSSRSSTPAWWRSGRG